jgi:ubiquinone biosynthesis protein
VSNPPAPSPSAAAPAPGADAPADLVWGAFSDNPPWILDRERITWLAQVAPLREAARREVPVLTEPGRLPRGIRVGRVAVRLGTAMGGWYVNKRFRGLTGDRSRADVSRRLRLAAEDLGPTYIKLGQIISSGEGLFPEELVREFKLCRDQVPAESFESVRERRRGRLGAPRGGLLLVRPHPAGRGLHRPGPRGALQTGERWS